MTRPTRDNSASAYASGIAEIDLEPILVKAMDSEEGYDWSLEFAKQVEREYRRYLDLCFRYPELPLVPSTYVDDFWHLHILDTINYAQDCEQVFGGFLHHFPYFGMRGEEDAANLTKAWTDTLRIYAETFGEAAPPSLWPKSQRCPKCGVRCRAGQTPASLMAKVERPRLDSVLH